MATKKHTHRERSGLAVEFLTGCGFEPHRCHCVVSLSKNINPSLVLVQPRKTCPFITERLLMGRKESNQTNKLKNTHQIAFQYRLLLNADQKYCRLLQREHSSILWIFIKLPFSIKTFVLSIFKWPLKTGFTLFYFTKQVLILLKAKIPIGLKST